MKTPRDKYMNDPEYHQLVTMLEIFIERARFTPSELREAAVLACINYEMRNVRDRLAALRQPACNVEVTAGLGGTFGDGNEN